MKNRTAAIIIVIFAVFCCGCPGLTALCWGSLSLFDFATGWNMTGIGDQNGYLASTFGGLCAGIILIVFVVLLAYFLLRKKKVVTTSDVPVPSSTPDEPLPPTI